MPIDTIIEFIIYVIPGFISVEIYRSVYPVKQRNEFTQIVWSILFGVIIVLFINWLDIHIFQNKIYSNQPDMPRTRYTLSLFLGGILLGILRIGIHRLRFYLSNNFLILKKIAPDPQSIWFKINNNKNKHWAVVYLKDNSIYLGYISSYKFDPDSVDQDFLLSNAKRVDDNLNEIYIVTGLGVYINTKDVNKIEFLEGV